MEEATLKLEIQDDKAMQKTNRTVSGLLGIDTIIMDNNEKKLIAAGDIDNEYPLPKPAHYARVVADRPTNACIIC